MDFKSSALKWSEKTWDESVGLFDDLDSHINEVLREMNLIGKKVSGMSIERLPKEARAEGNLPKCFQFSKIFHEIEDSPPHPLQFISKICKNYYDYLEKRDDYTVPLRGISARGMRTLASFYREVDFTERIEKMMTASKIGTFNIVRNTDEDVRGHSDLIVKISDYEFRIWLFQISVRGLANTSDRLIGNRGKLPGGIHIICGQNTEKAEQVSVVEGWHLYSDGLIQSCIEEMKKILEGTKTTMKYSEIVKILGAPSELLSNINAFEVK